MFIGKYECYCFRKVIIFIIKESFILLGYVNKLKKIESLK